MAKLFTRVLRVRLNVVSTCLASVLLTEFDCRGIRPWCYFHLDFSEVILLIHWNCPQLRTNFTAWQSSHCLVMGRISAAARCVLQDQRGGSGKILSKVLWTFLQRKAAANSRTKLKSNVYQFSSEQIFNSTCIASISAYFWPSDAVCQQQTHSHTN